MPKKAAVRKQSAEVTEIPETKEQKLVRLGGKRVASALQRIRLIGNLHSYKPTDGDIDKIMTALGDACAGVEARLRGTRKESYTFTLR